MDLWTRAYDAYDANDVEMDLIAREMESKNPRRIMVAARKLAAVGRKVFDLPPLDPATGEGYSDDECQRLWSHFIDWEQSLGEGIATTPNGSPSTAGLREGSGVAADDGA